MCSVSLFYIALHWLGHIKAYIDIPLIDAACIKTHVSTMRLRFNLFNRDVWTHDNCIKICVFAQPLFISIQFQQSIQNATRFCHKSQSRLCARASHTCARRKQGNIFWNEIFIIHSFLSPILVGEWIFNRGKTMLDYIICFLCVYIWSILGGLHCCAHEQCSSWIFTVWTMYASVFYV